MNIATVLKTSMALPLIAMLALTGCGGGGSSGTPAASNEIPPSQTPQSPGAGTGTGGTGGTGTGGTGGTGTGGTGGTGTGGTGAGGAALMPVCGEAESYCHTLEKRLNAATTAADLQFFADILALLSQAVSQGDNRVPDHDFYRLGAVEQQALIDLYYRLLKAFDQPSAKSPPAPPQTPPTAPKTGSYTSQNGPVASWGVWKSDQPSPANNQRRFDVGTLTQEGFYANYAVTGEVTASTSSLPNGTATWEGEYEGVYQLADETGVWGSQANDSGTASIEVDFTTNENAVTVTLTSSTTDAKTLPGGSDTAGDEWVPTADLIDPKMTFNNDRVNAKPSDDDDTYVKIAGAVFGANAEALAGVYEFEYRKDHPTDTYDGEAVRVSDIRGAGWFGGCKDVSDFSCFQADAVTAPDPDPMDDPVPDPVDPPMEEDPPMTTPGTYSHLSFGAWGDKPGDFDADDNDGDFTASLQGTDHYYLRGTRTSQADMDGLPTMGMATWAGTYEGQYRENPADSSGWGAFANDSGTVAMDMDLATGNMDITLTSTVGNTFPGVTDMVDTPKNSFVFDANVSFSGRQSGSFGGGADSTDGAHDTASALIEGAFFGAEAAEAGGVYNITQVGASTVVQVEAVGVFGATKQ